jgi:hypothetical protein
MIMCPLDMCKNNHQGHCTRTDVVLEIADEDENLMCRSYSNQERKDEND